MGKTAGSVVKGARQRAGLSQSELARRAGVAQPVISAYESGRREPSLTMLTKLVEASGHRLLVDVSPLPGLRRGLPNTPMGRRLRRRRRAVIGACSRRGAMNVRVFGSVARGEDRESSDIDLLVDLDEDVGLVALAGLGRELRELLDAEVDVVPAAALKPALQPQVMAEAIPL
jgi:predicted nucleotidyltransferase/DNA-binding XRE family transcriptional regulator